jgi:hypothetical protein
MHPIVEIQHYFNAVGRGRWSFTGQTAVKLHAETLLHKRAILNNVVDVAIKSSFFVAFWNVLTKLGYRHVRRTRNVHVFKRGPVTVKIHEYDRLPQMTSYNQRTPIMSLRNLPKQNRDVKRMNNFVSIVKRSAGSLNNVN